MGVERLRAWKGRQSLGRSGDYLDRVQKMPESQAAEFGFARWDVDPEPGCGVLFYCGCAAGLQDLSSLTGVEPRPRQ